MKVCNMCQKVFGRFEPRTVFTTKSLTTLATSDSIELCDKCLRKIKRYIKYENAVNERKRWSPKEKKFRSKLRWKLNGRQE